MNSEDLLYKEVTGKIIGCAMKVHRHFGIGFPEVIYKRALLLELGNVNLKSKSEFEKDIYYNNQFIGKRRLDLLVEDKVLVEVKATHELDERSISQILNYMKIFGISIGLLINFGDKSLCFKRLINSKKSVESI